MRCWNLCPQWNLALGAAAKCGSTTLRQLVIANDPELRKNPASATPLRLGWSDVPQGFRRIAVVRHPVDRFASLYANIQQRKRSRNNFYAQFEGLSPWATFDGLIAASPFLDSDFHFQAQTLCLGPGIEAVRLESFGKWWAQHYPDAVPPRHLNESQAVEIDDRTAARVVNRYRDELDLWIDAWHA